MGVIDYVVLNNCYMLARPKKKVVSNLSEKIFSYYMTHTRLCLLFHFGGV